MSSAGRPRTDRQEELISVLKSLTARDTTQDERSQFAQRFLDLTSLEVPPRLESRKRTVSRLIASGEATEEEHMEHELMRADPGGGSRYLANRYAGALRDAFGENTDLFPTVVNAFYTTNPQSDEAEVLYAAVIASLRDNTTLK